MERICASDLGAEGKIAAAAWLNDHGGTEALVSVVRLAAQQFLIISNAATSIRDKAWLARHIEDGLRVVIDDVTSNFALFMLAGPSACALVATLAGSNVADHRIGDTQEFELGYAHGMISRTSRVGEPCYQLMVSTEMAAGVYDAIVESGTSVSLAHVGQHAWRSLCMEKSARNWGEVIGERETPRDAGLDELVSTTRTNFIGAKAVQEKPRAKPRRKKLVSFLLQDAQPQLYVNEPIWCENEIVGYVCSAMYGHTVGGAIGMGYIECASRSDNDISTASYEIDIAGEHYRARASVDCFYDPENLRDRNHAAI
jgi:4-methylaminobutanoate oxidase (formaldehyde-forming)